MSSAAQRAELQSQIWKIANEVRGSVDGWDFKQYVLGTLFYRFISENFSNYIEGGDETVNYAGLDDKIITKEIIDDAIIQLFDSKEEKEYISKSVDKDKIAEENYNLSVSSYVEAKDTREKIDIVKLNAKIEEIVLREDKLREAIRDIIADIEV